MGKQITQEQREILITNLQEALEEQLNHTKKYVEIAEELEITNEQFFIEWEMKMSYLVTQDHNK